MRTKTSSKRSRRATAYDKGQHELICAALKVSPDPYAPGDTAYEAVCVTLTKLDAARNFINRVAKMAHNTDPLQKEAKELQRIMRKKTFNFLHLYGTEPEK